MNNRFALICIVLAAWGRSPLAWAVSGTEGASFLDIPVGGAPAAMGSAYTAAATDAYAPVWNPAGLGRLQSMEFAGTHLNYLEAINYEFASFVIPFGSGNSTNEKPRGVGVSAQYLGTGDLNARDEAGNPAGTFTSAFAAYSLAYGQRLGDEWAMGTTAKVITAKISDASASAYAGDLGILYQPNKTVSIGAVAANLGTSLKLVDEADSLPAAGRLGASFHWSPEWDMTVETVYRKTGLLSGQAGVEWRYGNIFALRGGFNSSRTKELGLGAGFSAGVGLFYLGQEFAYAYVPLGDLGQTHYLSLVFRFTSQPRPGRPVLHADSSDRDYDDLKSEGFGGYQNLYDVLSDDEKKSLEKNK